MADRLGWRRSLAVAALASVTTACAAEGPRAVRSRPATGPGETLPTAPPALEVAAGPAFIVRANEVLLERHVVGKVVEQDTFDPAAPWDVDIEGPLRDGLADDPRSDPAIGQTRRCSLRIDGDVRLNFVVQAANMVSFRCRGLLRVEESGRWIDLWLVVRRLQKSYTGASWPSRLLVVRVTPTEARLTWTLPREVRGKAMPTDGPTRTVARPSNRAADWPELARAVREACGPSSPECHARLDYMVRDGAIATSTYAEVRPALRAIDGALREYGWHTLSLLFTANPLLVPSYPYIEPWR